MRHQDDDDGHWAMPTFIRVTKERAQDSRSRRSQYEFAMIGRRISPNLAVDLKFLQPAERSHRNFKSKKLHQN